MIVKIVKKDGQYYSFYEGAFIGICPKEHRWEDGVTIQVDGRTNSVTLEIEKGDSTQVYLMNDQGKTVETLYI